MSRPLGEPNGRQSRSSSMFLPEPSVVDDVDSCIDSDDDDSAHPLVDFNPIINKMSNINNNTYTNYEVLPALALRPTTTDTGCTRSPRDISFKVTTQESTRIAPAVLSFPIQQVESREAKHMINALRIFGSVGALAYTPANGKNSGYTDGTMINCGTPGVGLTPRGCAPIEKAVLPHLPTTAVLRDHTGSGSKTPRTPGSRGSAAGGGAVHAPPPDVSPSMELTFNVWHSPRAGMCSRGMNNEKAASPFFRINSPRGNEYSPSKPQTAMGRTNTSNGSPAQMSRLGLSMPILQTPRTKQRIFGDDVFSGEHDFVQNETIQFENTALAEAKIQVKETKRQNSGNLAAHRVQNHTSALLRKLFHTKVAVESEIAKHICRRGREDMTRLALDVKSAMNRLGLRSLDPSDFYNFLELLLEGIEVSFSESRYLFALLDTNASKQIDVNEMAEGLELLTFSEEQIALSYGQKLFAEPNKYRDVRLSYFEVLSIFQTVLRFFGSTCDLGSLLHQAELLHQQLKAERHDPDGTHAKPSTEVPIESHFGSFKKKPQATSHPDRLVRPTLDLLLKKLEAEAVCVLRQVWRFSMSKNGQMHIPLLRTLMQADGPMLVLVCQGVPASLRLNEAPVVRLMLDKEIVAYEDKLAAITGEVDAMLSVKKELKATRPLPSVGSSKSSQSQSRSSLLTRNKQESDSTLIKGKALSYDEVEKVFARYDSDYFYDEKAQSAREAKAQDLQRKSSVASSTQQGRSGMGGRRGTVRGMGQRSVSNAAPIESLLPPVEVEEKPKPSAISILDERPQGEPAPAIDPWHFRFTADLSKVQDSDRQRDALEHLTVKYESFGKLVLKVEPNGVKVPWM